MRDGLIEKDYVNEDVKSVSPRLKAIQESGNDFESIN